jgi:hypothetical protein
MYLGQFIGPYPVKQSLCTLNAPQSFSLDLHLFPLMNNMENGKDDLARLITLSAPNDVDLRFDVFLLWAKRRRSTSKYLNFPPYDVIGMKLKSMISATNTAVR